MSMPVMSMLVLKSPPARTRPQAPAEVGLPLHLADGLDLPLEAVTETFTIVKRSPSVQTLRLRIIY